MQRWPLLAAAVLFLAAGRPCGADDQDSFAQSLQLEGARFIRVKEGFFFPRVDALPGPGPGAVARISGWFWHCSGSYISTDGYVLTNSHCVTLPGAQRAWSGPEFDGYSLPATATLFKDAPGPLVDRLRSTLVAAGRGWVTPKRAPVDLSALAGVPGVAQRLRELASGDWAILHVDLERPARCAAVSDRAPRPGESLTGFGYAGEAARSGGNSSGGHLLKMVTGVVSSEIAQSEWLATLNPPTRAIMTEIYDPAIRDGDVLLGDQDSIGGMSGSPVFAASGEQLAVHAASGIDAWKYRAHSALGVTIKKIFADLRSAGEDPKKYFSCPPPGRSI